MRIQSLCLFLALLLTPAISRAEPIVRQWIVVVAPAFREAVAPLAAHRRAEG